jgi:hypothetical protein
MGWYVFAFSTKYGYLAFSALTALVCLGLVWQGRRLVAFNRAALRKDWRLVWTSVPLVEEAALPPASCWGLLCLRSPPPFESLAAHLEAIGIDGGNACLANWPQEVRARGHHTESRNAWHAMRGTAWGSGWGEDANRKRECEVVICHPEKHCAMRCDVMQGYLVVEYYATRTALVVSSGVVSPLSFNVM